MSIGEIFEVLGEPEKESAHESWLELLEYVRQGLPASSIEHLAKCYYAPIERIYEAIGVSKATGTRKRSKAALLRPAASDRLMRLAQVLVLARSVFEDLNRAQQWFQQENRALHGEKPIDLLDTEIGTQQVERVLRRIEHGTYS